MIFAFREETRTELEMMEKSALPCVQALPGDGELMSKVEPVVESMGYGLRNLEIQRGRSSLVRVTLEHLDPSQTIGIDDCERVHEALGPLFDVWDPFTGAYTLEVSSPGERPQLRLLRHFEAALGENVRIETREALPMPAPAKPRRNWQGQLLSVDAEAQNLALKDEFGQHSIPFNQIRSAIWLREWSTKEKQQ